MLQPESEGDKEDEEAREAFLAKRLEALRRLQLPKRLLGMNDARVMEELYLMENYGAPLAFLED